MIRPASLFIIFCIINSFISKTDTIESIYESFKGMTDKEVFKAWHHLSEKDYSITSEDAHLKFRTFKQNLRKIRKFNLEGHSHQRGIGPLTDLSTEEYNSIFLTSGNDLKKNVHISEYALSPLDYEEDSDEDLSKRVLTENPENKIIIDNSQLLQAPRKQFCGESHAHAVLGNLEMLDAKRNGKSNKILSVQQIQECSYLNTFCSGSIKETLLYALRYGIQEESTYPQKKTEGTCKYNTDIANVNPVKIQLCENNDCSFQKLVNYLKTTGSFISAIDGNLIENYKSGIINEECHKNYQKNHSVLVVGLGVEDGQKYWIVRNSFGDRWGEFGHFRIAVKDGIECGIETEAYTFN